MLINALCLNNATKALKECDELHYVGTDTPRDSRIKTICDMSSLKDDVADIFVPSLLRAPEELGAVFDRVIESGTRAIVMTSYDYNETGLIESRFKLSPIMFLHKIGVLANCIIAGGVCLDNDDLDLMAQENVPLILLPTHCAGMGYGFAPVCAAIARGLRVGIGTFLNKYNSSASVEYEAEFLRLTANAEMRREDSISNSELSKILSFS